RREQRLSLALGFAEGRAAGQCSQSDNGYKRYAHCSDCRHGSPLSFRRECKWPETGTLYRNATGFVSEMGPFCLRPQNCNTQFDFRQTSDKPFRTRILSRDLLRMSLPAKGLRAALKRMENRRSS